MSIMILYLFPEFTYTAFKVSRVFDNIVKYDHSTGPHQRRVHFKIGPHALIGVVTIDEQEIELLVVQNRGHPFPNFDFMGVIPN